MWLFKVERKGFLVFLSLSAREFEKMRLFRKKYFIVLMMTVDPSSCFPHLSLSRKGREGEGYEINQLQHRSKNISSSRHPVVDMKLT